MLIVRMVEACESVTGLPFTFMGSPKRKARWGRSQRAFRDELRSENLAVQTCGPVSVRPRDPVVRYLGSEGKSNPEVEIRLAPHGRVVSSMLKLGLTNDLKRSLIGTR